MTANLARLPTLPDGLVREIRRRYALPDVEIRERLVGGYANDVFLAASPSGPLVVRVKHPPVIPASIAWEHRLLSLLARCIREAGPPIAARDGTTFFLHGRFAVSVFVHVGGAPARPDDRRHRREAARVLGRVHAAAAEMRVGQRPAHPRLSDLPFPQTGGLPPELAAWTGRLSEMRLEAIRFVRELAGSGRPLTTGVIHGDFFLGNVLVDDGHATALLDWEESHLDWQAYDLATAAWDFCKSDGADLDREAARTFRAAYRASGGTVSPAEDDLFEPFIRIKRILEVLRAPTDRHVDWDHQLENLRAAERLR